MKKFTTWGIVISIIIMIIVCVVGTVKLSMGNYDIAVETYIAYIAFLVLTACNLYRVFGNKCPHCGKLRLSSGEYCSHCGKEI